MYSMPKLDFNPEKEIPSLEGKVILITGGTAGLGYESAVSLAAHNAEHIFFTGRSQTSADKLLKEVHSKHPKSKITFVQCDQTSLSSVQQAAQAITSQTSRLDVVIANAGIMAQPPAQTKEGYEIQFGTNHVAHALLVKLLLPLLDQTAKQTSDVRVIWLTSLGYGFHPKGGILFDKVQTNQAKIVWWSSFFGAWFRYGQSKLANLLYARAFAKHHPNITSVAVHPGTAATGLVTNLPWTQRWFIYATTIGQLIPAEQCAWNQQWAATTPKERLENGKFYEPVGQTGRMMFEAPNEILAETLYDWTEKELERWTVS